MTRDSIEQIERAPTGGRPKWNPDASLNGVATAVDRERERRAAIYARQLAETGRIQYLPRVDERDW
jgi:hypothetical protein